MIRKESLLHRLSGCVQQGTSMPILLRHQREALARRGLGRERARRIRRVFDALIEDARRHAAALGELRETVLRSERDVF